METKAEQASGKQSWHPVYPAESSGGRWVSSETLPGHSHEPGKQMLVNAKFSEVAASPLVLLECKSVLSCLG